MEMLICGLLIITLSVLLALERRDKEHARRERDLLYEVSKEFFEGVVRQRAEIIQLRQQRDDADWWKDGPRSE